VGEKSSIPAQHGVISLYAVIHDIAEGALLRQVKSLSPEVASSEQVFNTIVVLHLSYATGEET
jgi:hypothetical protein